MVEVVASKPRGKEFEVKTASGDALRLPETLVFSRGIFPGSRFETAEWQAILAEGERERCYQGLLRLLASRPHSQSEAQRKLRQRGHAPAAVTHALAKAEQVGLVDDRLFARLFIQEREDGGADGEARIVAELSRRGIARALAQAVYAELRRAGEVAPVEAQKDKAVVLAARKWATLLREPDQAKRKAKLLRFLAGRGFAPGTCYEAVRRVAGDAEDDAATSFD